jgi:REP element-mobilizing transposase RayT
MGRFPVRKKIRLPLPVYSQGHAFFITITTHQKHPWFHLHPKLSETAIHIIRDLAALRHAAIYSWCIMPDHVHLLLQDQNVVDFVRLFKGRMTPKAREIQPERPLWQRSLTTHCARKSPWPTLPATYGKIRCAQQWRRNPKNIAGLDPRSGLNGGSFTGGDKLRPYVVQ